MSRRIAALAASAVVITAAAPAAAEVAPMPREKALDKYSALWHKCAESPTCDAPRNVRRTGTVRFKWISKDGERRHWGTRPAYAHDVAKRIRKLRRATTPRYWTGAWAIPAPIVMCESGGTNTPPNYASASGYYQILASTWRLFGGLRFAPQAYLASRAQQDAIAALIWKRGGPSQWVCAGLVGWR